MIVKDEEVAFPLMIKGTPLGLTKREYFAAKAMQGLLSIDTNWTGNPKALANESVFIADCLLEALKN